MITPENGQIVLPRHLAIIPDGNGRWAQKHGLEIWQGHLKGAQRMTSLVETMDGLDIEVVTFWGFSTENWSRSSEEVSKIFEITQNMIDSEAEKWVQKGRRFRHAGRKDRLPESLLRSITQLEEKTAQNQGKTFVLAFDYGGRDEIVRAVNRTEGRQIDESTFKSFLDTTGLPDPDLIIRTAGEMRTSGMYLYQGVYAEFISSALYFPDFDEKELMKCLTEFSKRERRFGARLRFYPERAFDWFDLKGNTFDDYLNALSPVLDRTTSSFFEQWKKGRSYGHFGLQEDIDVYQGLLTGGKKIRPSLVMLAFENFRGEPEFREGALLASIAYEVIHNSFLVHDDIEDESLLRRGRPSVHEQYRIMHEQSGGILDHRQYGKAVAINTGSLGPFKALETIWNIDNRNERIVAVQKWLRYVIETTLRGQRRDLTDIPLEELTENYVYRIYHQKTAVYTMVGPLTLGAILAGISGKDLEYLNTFGVNLGIAFQMVDDHLGMYGNEQVLGKPVDSDIREAKKTLHFVKAFQTADPFEREFLRSIWGKQDASLADLSQVRTLIEQLRVKDVVLDRADTLAARARSVIPRITNNPTIRSILEGLTSFVVARNY